LHSKLTKSVRGSLNFDFRNTFENCSKGSYLKVYLRIYFYKLRVSKDKVITYKGSHLEGLRANYLSAVVYIGH
jgi:hypothetical protein